MFIWLDKLKNVQLVMWGFWIQLDNLCILYFEFDILRKGLLKVQK